MQSVLSVGVGAVGAVIDFSLTCLTRFAVAGEPSSMRKTAVAASRASATVFREPGRIRSPVISSEPEELERIAARRNLLLRCAEAAGTQCRPQSVGHRLLHRDRPVGADQHVIGAEQI